MYSYIFFSLSFFGKFLDNPFAIFGHLITWWNSIFCPSFSFVLLSKYLLSNFPRKMKNSTQSQYFEKSYVVGRLTSVCVCVCFIFIMGNALSVNLKIYLPPPSQKETWSNFAVEFSVWKWEKHFQVVFPKKRKIFSVRFFLFLYMLYLAKRLHMRAEREGKLIL